MKSLLSVIAVFLFSACAPLSHHESAWGDAGEVIGRTLLCPITLCTSELMYAADYDRRQQYERREAWLRSLPPEQRAEELQREAAALNALGLSLMGGGPFPAYRPAPYLAPAMPSTAPLSCTSTQAGAIVRTNCY